MTPIDIDRVEAQRRAAEELAKAKYGGTPQFLEDAFNWLIDWLVRLDTWLAGLGGSPAGGALNPGFILAVALLLTALVVVVWRVGLPRWRRRNRTEASLALDRTRSATDYRVEADAAARAGDWASAVRDRFRALVRELEVVTVLEVRPARTAWEAATSAAGVLPDHSADLYAAADLFSAVSYGDRPAGAEDYAAMAGIDERVSAAAAAVDLAADPVPQPDPVHRR